jgi:DNA-binding response OmpR family regulator
MNVARAVFSHEPEGDLMKPRILIVDDDAAITQQLFWTLCDDYEVLMANDLQTALRRATIYEPAVSILDLHLPPVLDSPEVGLRILEYIKDRFPQSKVLIISSAATDEMQKTCLESGADGFLDKPFEIEQLLATVRRYAPERRFDAV